MVAGEQMVGDCLTDSYLDGLVRDESYYHNIFFPLCGSFCTPSVLEDEKEYRIAMLLAGLERDAMSLLDARTYLSMHP